MVRRMIQLMLMSLLVVAFSTPAVLSDKLTRDYNMGDDDEYGYMGHTRADRYLDVEIWTNHNDGEYYDGDNIVIYFRANSDAFVAIYSIDTRGRVDMLFPASPGDNNYIRGGVTYRLPDDRDDYDLVVTGPEGVENLQIIASREPFPIPDWYPVSGLVCDWDDRYDFMDYLNDRYFVRYSGQRFAYDRTSIYVNEWEDYYFRPVYYPPSHYWTVWGNVYIDYPFGASVYIDGVYWGVTPLYIPRIYVGWNTFTIYDRWGYCWESDIHISRYTTVILDNTIVRTSPSVQSKFKEVRIAGYRNPVNNGYPNYKQKKKAILSSKAVTTKKISVSTPTGKAMTQILASGPKKYARGSAKIVKTKRGWETSDIVAKGKYSGKSSRSTYKSTVMGKSKSSASSKSKKYSAGSSNWGFSGSNGKQPRGKTTVQTGGNSSSHASGKISKGKRSSSRTKESSGYYQKKTGSKYRKAERKATIKSTRTKSDSKSKARGSSYKAKSSKGSSSTRNKGYKSSSGSHGKSAGSSYRPSSGGSKSSGGKSSAPKSTRSGNKSGGKHRR